MDSYGFANTSWDDIADYCITTVIDGITDTSVASVASFIANVISKDGTVHMKPGDLMIYAGAVWQRQYVEVYFEEGGYWSPSQCSEYANITTYFLATSITAQESSMK